MKKKLLALLVVGIMSLSMTACGGSSDSETQHRQALPQKQPIRQTHQLLMLPKSRLRKMTQTFQPNTNLHYALQKLTVK